MWFISVPITDSIEMRKLVLSRSILFLKTQVINLFVILILVLLR
jgi:hypothetical protein